VEYDGGDLVAGNLADGEISPVKPPLPSLCLTGGVPVDLGA
jgi:hypothetical protein